MTDEDVTINASGKVLGRLASEAAFKLQGKDLPDYAPNRFPQRQVIIEGASGIAVTGKKFEDKKYFRHTGFPGGIKSRTFKELFEKDPAEVIRRAIQGMLPKNKLRKQMLKNLTIKP
jgi:large subunit ribosomal protein L13